jgi:hypothetical protein
MYDIFDPALETIAKERGIHLLRTKQITKPLHTAEFTMAASTDRALFKAEVSMLYDLELLDKRPDHLHHRNAGLDSTLAKLCTTHNILVGINLANLRTHDPIIMGRIMQTIAICRQHKTRMAVFSSAKKPEELPHEQDVQSLLLVLGMSTQQAKETLGNLEKKHKELSKKRQ